MSNKKNKPRSTQSNISKLISANPQWENEEPTKGTPYASKAKEIAANPSALAQSVSKKNNPLSNFVTSVKRSSSTSVNSSLREGEHSSTLEYRRAAQEYDDYMQSDERKKKVDDATAEKNRGLMARGETSPTEYARKVSPQDDKEAELRAKRDYYERRVQEEQDLLTFRRDMREIDAMPQSDRDLFAWYVMGKDSEFDRSVTQGNEAIPLFSNYDKAAQPLFEKYGEKRVREMAASYRRAMNAQATNDTAQIAQDLGSGKYGAWGVAGGNALSYATSVASGITGTVGLAKQISGSVPGQYTTLDPNDIGNLPNVFTGNVRGATAQSIEEGVGGPGGKALSVVYQGATSAVDSGIRALFGSNVGLGLAGMSSFSQAVSDASRNGASPARAVANGVWTATMEVVSEKTPLDNLISAASGGKQTYRQIISRAMAQAGIEVTTEELSLFGSVLGEMAILRESSSYNRMVSDLVASGYSYEEAKEQADKAFINEAINTAAVSFVSAGLSSAGASVVGNVVAGDVPVDTQADVQETPVEAPAPVEAAAPSPEVQEVEAVRFPGNPPDALADVMDIYLRDGTISNRVAENLITSSPDSVQWLADHTGMEMSGTKSQQRQAVKNAIRTFFTSPIELSTNDSDAFIAAAADDIVNGRSTQPEETSFSPEDVQRGIEMMFGIEPQADADTASAVKKLEDTLSFFRNDPKNVPLDRLIDLTKDENVLAALEEAYGKPIESLDDLEPAFEAFANAGKPQKPGKGKGKGRATTAASGPVQPSQAVQPQTETETDQDGTPPTAPASPENTGNKKMSKLYSNTYQNATDEKIRDIGKRAMAIDPDIAMYDPETEAGQNAEADARLSKPGSTQREHTYLMGKEIWTAADIKTAHKLLEVLDDEALFAPLAKKARQFETLYGQGIQAVREYTRGTPVGVASAAMEQLESLGKKGISKKFYEGKGFEAWSKDVRQTILDVAKHIDDVKDGDITAMKNIVRDIAIFRHNTAFWGYSKNKLPLGTRAALKVMDFQTAKETALAQLSMIPNDFRKRSTGEVIKSIRIMNMLNSFVTTLRNLQGNGGMGFSDALSDSTVGQLADMVISQFTGIRTTGSDITQVKESLKGALDAWNFATMCIELDIPMPVAGAYDEGGGRDNGTRFTSGSTNTFSSQGGFLSRFFAAYSRYMSYALNATDSVFSEGAASATKASLDKLGESSGLSAAQKEAIGKFTGERRTFKENRMLTKGATKVKEGLNDMTFGIAGEAVLPFVGVPTNVIHTAIDYSGFGIVEGLGEMISVAKAAENYASMSEQEQIDFAVRQRKAVSDFGRGVTGVGLIALGVVAATNGVLTYTSSDDWDEENADLNRYLEGAQINWSALWRIMSGQKGGSLEPQEGDIVSGLESLGQFGPLFAIAAIFAREDLGLGEKFAESAMALYNTLMEMPSLQALSDISDLVQTDWRDEDEAMSALGTFIGDVASPVLPAFSRNIAQAMDPVIRDTSDSNPFVAAGKRLISAIPGLSTTLPAKYDPLTGKEQRRDETVGEAIWNRIFAPDAWHRVKENEITTYLDDLSEQTGDTSVYPDRQAPKSITYGEETISLDSKEDVELYQKTYGEAVSRLYSGLIGSAEFQSLSPTAQTEALNEAERLASLEAKYTVVGYEGFSNASKKEMFRLAEATGSSSAFYEPPSTEITYTDKNGFQKSIEMTDQQYEQYSRREQTVFNQVFTDLIRTQNYKALSDEGKMNALSYAREYARNSANAYVFRDYYQDPESWMYEANELSKTPFSAQKVNGEQGIAPFIAQKVQNEQFNRSVSAFVEDIGNGFNTSQSSQGLEQAYEDFTNLPAFSRKAIREQATGNTSYYLTARGDGVNHHQAAAMVQTFTELQGHGTGKDGAVRDADRYVALSGLGFDDESTDILIRAYMPDGENAEKRYDYLRDEGYTPAQVARFNMIYTEEYSGGAGYPDRIRKMLMREFGMNKETADAIYKMYAGREKPWND